MAVQILRVAGGVAHRGNGQPALFRRVNHLDVQIGGHEDAVEERIGIARLANRTGGHRPNPLDLIEAEHLPVVAQHGHGRLHGAGPQPSAPKGVLPQPYRPLKPLQDVEPAVRQDLGDYHPQGVRADVDGGDRLGRLRGVGRFSLRLRHSPCVPCPAGAEASAGSLAAATGPRTCGSSNGAAARVESPGFG